MFREKSKEGYIWFAHTYFFEEPPAIYVPLKFAEMVKEVKLTQAKKVSGSFEEKRIGDRCHHLHTAWHKCVPFKIQCL